MDIFSSFFPYRMKTPIAFEWDGSTESDDKAADTSTLPDYSAPVISNVTAIGIGKDGTSLNSR